MNVYFISGLAADERAFQLIRLPSSYTIHHLSWIKPLKGETINAYAKRLAAGIDTSKPFCLVGLSFGGMVATEMNTFLKPVKTILLSSTYTIYGLPAYVRWLGILRIHKLVKGTWLKKLLRPAHWFFGAKTGMEKKLLDVIILESDPHFIEWAIDAILTWKNKTVPAHCIRIHGSRDKILPECASADVVIKGGGHFMVFNKARQVNRALAHYLDSPSP